MKHDEFINYYRLYDVVKAGGNLYLVCEYLEFDLKRYLDFAPGESLSESLTKVQASCFHPCYDANIQVLIPLISCTELHETSVGSSLLLSQSQGFAQGSEDSKPLDRCQGKHKAGRLRSLESHWHTFEDVHARGTSTHFVHNTQCVNYTWV